LGGPRAPGPAPRARGRRCRGDRAQPDPLGLRDPGDRRQPRLREIRGHRPRPQHPAGHGRRGRARGARRRGGGVGDCRPAAARPLSRVRVHRHHRRLARQAQSDCRGPRRGTPGRTVRRGRRPSDLARAADRRGLHAAGAHLLLRPRRRGHRWVPRRDPPEDAGSGEPGGIAVTPDSIAVLAAAVRAGTPVLFATLGEIFAERAGILNLGVEGMMLVGALAGFAATARTGNPWAGAAAAGLVGGCLGLIHALLTITLRANQVASGLALTIFGTGVSAFLGRGYVGVPASGFQTAPLPLLSRLPGLGPILFQQDPFVYLSFAAVPIAWYVLYRTRWGLEIRAVGERPEAADAMGVDVARVRYACVTAGGILAGLGGAFLSTAYTSMWIENMTAGRGWIAVALVIFATW